MTALKIGACMPVMKLPKYRDWLIEGQRDLEIQDFASADILNGDWRGVVEFAKGTLDGYAGRMGIHGPFWGFTIHSRDPDVRQIVAKRMDQALDAAEALGATHMVVHSPYSTWDYNNIDNYPDARDQVIALAHETLGAAVKRAEGMGLTLVIENIEDIDPMDRVRLAESFGSEAVKVSVDTGHAHYAHGSTGAPPVDYYVRAAGAMLAHVHLQDADGYADRHWSIGEGTVRWPAVFRALRETSAAPRLVLELRDHDRIPDSMAYLEREGLGC